MTLTRAELHAVLNAVDVQLGDMENETEKDALSAARAKLLGDLHQPPDRALRVGLRLARKIFAKRGNHSEVHISEVQLAALLALAADYWQGLHEETTNG